MFIFFIVHRRGGGGYRKKLILWEERDFMEEYSPKPGERKKYIIPC